MEATPDHLMVVSIIQPVQAYDDGDLVAQILAA